MNNNLLYFRSEIENELGRLLSCADDLPYAALFTAARYSLLAPAKRMRPLMLAAVAGGYGAPLEAILPPACALEMIHTYSLVHDDLPCMDDDDLRRGRPTLHKIYPEWHALLAGDFLLTYAFEVMADSPNLTSDQKVALISLLSKHSGAHGMIGGQMIDLLSTGSAIPFSTLELMHRCKTAALISAALCCGAIVANAPKKDIELLKKAGEAIGFAFQLIDDVLDYEGDPLEMGKSAGSDASNCKTTAVGLLGISETKAKAVQLHAFAKKAITELSTPLPLLDDLFDQMIHRRK